MEEFFSWLELVNGVAASERVLWTTTIVTLLGAVLKAYSETRKHRVSEMKSNVTSWTQLSAAQNAIVDDLVRRLNESDEKMAVLENRLDDERHHGINEAKRRSELQREFDRVVGRLDMYQSCPKTDCPFKHRYKMTKQDLEN